MATLNDLIKADDDTLKKLQRALLEKQEQIRILDGLEVKLKGIKEGPKDTLDQVRRGRSELSEIGDELSKLRATSPTVSSAMAERRAADELAEALDKGGLRLKKRLPGVVDAVMKKPRATTTDLRNALADELIAEAGKMATPMANFLSKSLGGQFNGFADPDYGIVYGSADDMVAKVVMYGSKHAGEYSGNLSRFVLNQVDRTQDATPFMFTRHVEANACKWCQQQVSVYEMSRKFFRHSNCRCMKVRR